MKMFSALKHNHSFGTNTRTRIYLHQLGAKYRKLNSNTVKPVHKQNLDKAEICLYQKFLPSKQYRGNTGLRIQACLDMALCHWVS